MMHLLINQSRTWALLCAIFVSFLGSPASAFAEQNPSQARANAEITESDCCRFHSVGLDAKQTRFLRDFADGESIRLRDELGLPARGEKIDIYITGSIKDFGINYEKRAPLPWVAGVANPKLRSIALHLSHFTVEELRITLSHELAHIYVWERSGGYRMPRWFEEGIAMLLAKEPTVRHLRTVLESYPTEALPELHEISKSFPRDSLAAHRAYATSYSFLRWSMEHRGEANVPQRILKLVSLETPFPRAFETVLGEAPENLEARWRSTLTSGLWIPLALHLNDLMWIFCALLVVIGGWKVWGRPREPEEDPEQEELELIVGGLSGLQLEALAESARRDDNESSSNGSDPPRFLH